MKAHWDDIVMANYKIDPQILTPFLPYGVEIKTFKGEAYISLVGFGFNKSKIFGIPIPVFGSFEEVNLRFYVKRNVDGRIKRGAVFISDIIPKSHTIEAFMANWLQSEYRLRHR